MSDTRIDMAKVTQMLDSGWDVRIFKNRMGSYEVMASHDSESVIDRIREMLRKLPVDSFISESTADMLHWYDDYTLQTDDFTPEQALTRMAYKVHGEII